MPVFVPCFRLKLLLAATLLVAACAGSPPSAVFDWESALQVRRPFAWKLESGPWEACTIVVRVEHPLDDADAEELEAVLTDWYNLARLSAFKDDPRHAGSAAAEAMAAPWLPSEQTLAATFHLGSMGRLGLLVLLNALTGYHDEQAPIDEVTICAAQPPPLGRPRGTA